MNDNQTMKELFSDDNILNVSSTTTSFTEAEATSSSMDEFLDGNLTDSFNANSSTALNSNLNLTAIGSSNNNNTFVTNGHMHPQHHQQQQQQQQQEDDSLIWALPAIFFIFWAFCLSGRSSRPPRELWRGEQIRENAQRIWRQRDENAKKQSQPIEHRDNLFALNMRTKKVIDKDANGNLALGNLDDLPSPQKGLWCQEVSTPPKECPANDGLDEEEQLCTICLDIFEVGDLVSWSRYSKTCHHVYHTECIEPWLKDKRQDECPYCRNNLFVKTTSDDGPNKTPKDGEDDDKKTDIGDSDDDSCSTASASSNSDEEDGGLFVIINGLIAKAAQHASNVGAYSLVATQGSFSSQSESSTNPTPEVEEDDIETGKRIPKKNNDDDDDASSSSSDSSSSDESCDSDFDDENDGKMRAQVTNMNELLGPSPFRRVASQGPMYRSPTYRRQRPSLSGSVRNLFGSSSSSDINGKAASTTKGKSEKGKNRHNGSIMEEKNEHESLLSNPVALQRSVSGPPTPTPAFYTAPTASRRRSSRRRSESSSSSISPDVKARNTKDNHSYGYYDSEEEDDLEVGRLATHTDSSRSPEQGYLSPSLAPKNKIDIHSPLMMPSPFRRVASQGSATTTPVSARRIRRPSRMTSPSGRLSMPFASPNSKKDSDDEYDFNDTEDDLSMPAPFQRSVSDCSSASPSTSPRLRRRSSRSSFTQSTMMDVENNFSASSLQHRTED